MANNTPHRNICNEFNNILNEFILKMIKTFPDQVKLNGYYKAFKISRLYNDELPLHIFMGGCLSFKTQIKTKDENFFKQRTEFVNKCNKYSSFSNDIGLVEFWDNISDLTKKSIWEYVQTLFVMGEIFLNNEEMLAKTEHIYKNISGDEIGRFENETVNHFSSDFLKKIK